MRLAPMAAHSRENDDDGKGRSGVPENDGSDRRARFLNELRAMGLNAERLRQITEHFITERAQADVLAARKFFSAVKNASAIQFSGLLGESTRLNGVLAAAIRLRDCPNDQDDRRRDPVDRGPSPSRAPSRGSVSCRMLARRCGRRSARVRLTGARVKLGSRNS
jgi:hypothetical protein